MKTSKKGAPRSGLVRHEVARNSIPHHETSKTWRSIEPLANSIEDRWEETKGSFDDWIRSMKLEQEIEREEGGALWLL